tara:strand:- start:25 stop:435 length:411 start_codon:yes stop_codon:yes gene_type:complete
MKITESEKNKIRLIHRQNSIIKQPLMEVANCTNEGGSCTIPSPWQVKKGCFKTGSNGCYCSSKPEHCASSTGSVKGGGVSTLDSTPQTKKRPAQDKRSEEFNTSQTNKGGESRITERNLKILIKRALDEKKSGSKN